MNSIWDDLSLDELAHRILRTDGVESITVVLWEFLVREPAFYQVVHDHPSIKRRLLHSLTDIVIEKGKFSDIQRVYEVARETISSEELVRIGEKYLEREKWDNALEAFDSSSVNISDQTLIGIGDTYFGQGDLHGALLLYQRAGDSDKMVGVATAYIKQGDAKGAYRAFAAAGKEMTQEHFFETRENLLERGHFGDFNSFFDVYESAGYTLTPEELVEFGDSCLEGELNNGKVNGAHISFKRAGRMDKLEKIGDALVERDAYHLAAKYYHLSNSQEKLLDCGHKCFERGWIEQAASIYGILGYESESTFLHIIAGSKKD